MSESLKKSKEEFLQEVTQKNFSGMSRRIQEKVLGEIQVFTVGPTIEILRRSDGRFRVQFLEQSNGNIPGAFSSAQYQESIEQFPKFYNKNKFP